jgi:serine/threonine protein kinase
MSNNFLMVNNNEIIVPECFIISSNYLEDNISINTANRKMWTNTVKGWYHNSAVIIKKMKTPTDLMIVEFKRIVYMAFKMHHPNIVHFYGISYNINNDTLSYVTEYLSEGPLSALLANYEFNHTQIIKIMLDVAKGMCYLHSRPKPIIHRDIRAENIHINCTLNAKITNLEFSGIYTLDKTLIGTPAWTAPEILLGNSDYSPKVDVYSYSMLCVEIFNKIVPYNENGKCHNSRELINRIVNCNYRPDILNKSTWPPKLIEMVESCWQTNPNMRPNFNEIIDMLLYKI